MISPQVGEFEPHPPHHSGTRRYLRERMCKRREQTSVGGGWRGDKETEQVSAGMGEGRERKAVSFRFG